MKSKWKSEAEFQAACYSWYMKTLPEKWWGRLIGIYNNPVNISQLISMGLRPGISDFLFVLPLGKKIEVPIGCDLVTYTPARGLCWIELKILGKKQNQDQVRFQSMVLGWGDEYHVVTEEIEHFINLINSKVYG